MGRRDDGELSRALHGETTTRDRWRCFYRLYRMAVKREEHLDGGASHCLRVLLPNSSPRLLRVLLESEPTIGGRSHYPMVIRKKLLDIERRKRLYGKGYQFLERDKFVARMLAQDGKEMTPEQVAETRISITRKLRAFAAERGWELPADDVALFDYLKRLRNA